MSQPMAIAFLVTAALAAIVSAVTAGDDKQPPFKITTKRDNDKVEVKVEKKKRCSRSTASSGSATS